MKVQLFQWRDNALHAESGNDVFAPEAAQLVLAFGEKDRVRDDRFFSTVRSLFPASDIVCCSTSGEILGEGVFEDTVSVTAICFEKAQIRCECVNITDFEGNTVDAARELCRRFPKEGLRSLMLFSDGSLVNGSDLVKSCHNQLADEIPVTGGMAGDGARFQSSVAGLNKAPEEGGVVAVGFYGEALIVGHGSFGGWDVFGLERTITRSEGNILYEIDGQNALQLYKRYLGPFAKNLPGSALLFPLSLKQGPADPSLVRTILSIDEERQCMKFAGDVPQGAKVRFMKGTFDRIIYAAGVAATLAYGDRAPKLAILISCVGRRLTLENRTDEEVQAVREIFGDQTRMTGFYSYGEISPLEYRTKCELHNQTMTITTFDEA